MKTNFADKLIIMLNFNKDNYPYGIKYDSEYEEWSMFNRKYEPICFDTTINDMEIFFKLTPDEVDEFINISS